MPNFRQKLTNFIRQLSTGQQESRAGDAREGQAVTSDDCFIRRYFSGQEDGRDEPRIVHGHTPQQLPARTIGEVSRQLSAAMTGPNGGLTTVNRKQRHLSISDPDVHFIDTTDDEPNPGGGGGLSGRDANSNNTGVLNCNLIPPPAEYSTGPSSPAPLQKSESTPNARGGSGMGGSGEPIAGVSDWECGNGRAYGRSTTLYERHPHTGVPAGEPIADCFAVVARQNSAILVLADGVNWGHRASLAARAAVHGCVNYLNQAVYTWNINTTTDAFVALLRSFHAAHNLILEEQGMLTTLTAVLVLPLVAHGRYIVCACNVGDSLAYVYSPNYGVREITEGSHDVNRMRDMRDALGALGPVDGTNPELGNLTCAMTEVDPGDIVFLTSDGVSDNLDPVVGKFTGLGGVEAHQRHKLGLLRTEDLLKNGVSGSGPPCRSARDLVELLVDFVTRLTAAKRHLLEDADLYQPANEGSGPQVTAHRATRKRLCAKLAAVPGKLDHATVVAYTVGEMPSVPPP